MLKALKLSELTGALNARLVSADASFDGVSIDSRAIKPGQLFIALAGPRFDGHDYLNDVAAKGAVAALVEAVLQPLGLLVDGRFEMEARSTAHLPITAPDEADVRIQVHRLVRLVRQIVEPLSLEARELDGEQLGEPVVLAPDLPLGARNAQRRELRHFLGTSPVHARGNPQDVVDEKAVGVIAYVPRFRLRIEPIGHAPI